MAQAASSSSTLSDAKFKRLAKSRVTFVLTAYYQTPGNKAVGVDARFGRWVDGEDGAYARPSFAVGERAVELDFGWLKAVSLVLVEVEKPKFATQPSKEALEEAYSRAIEVAADGVVIAHVRPGEAWPVTPLGHAVTLRCVNGTVKCSYTAFPG